METTVIESKIGLLSYIQALISVMLGFSLIQFILDPSYSRLHLHVIFMLVFICPFGILLAFAFKIAVSEEKVILKYFYIFSREMYFSDINRIIILPYFGDFFFFEKNIAIFSRKNRSFSIPLAFFANGTDLRDYIVYYTKKKAVNPSIEL